jgi:DNA mismatch repair protein MutS
MSTTLMMDSYYKFQSDLEKKYGLHSVIFMMVGSFYEMYQSPTIGKAQEMSSMLNIALTKKDKKKELSNSNPYMCGFPSYCLHKYVDILVRHYDYTVGIVDQSEDSHDLSTSTTSARKLKRRELAKIYSPSIPYEYEIQDSENTLTNGDVHGKEHVCMVFTIQKQKRNHLSKDERLFLSYVIANLSFGQLYYGEEEFADEMELCDHLNRIMTQEYVGERIYLQDYPISFDRIYDIKTHIITDLDSKYTNLVYQQKVCQRVFPESPEDRVIEDLLLVRHPMIVQQLTFLFDFIYDHCPLVLSKLQPPKLMASLTAVHYNIRSFYELNILNGRKIDRKNNQPERSLMDILDHTSTRMGSRYLRHLFFVPTYDVSILRKRYDKVDFYINHPEMLAHYRACFSKVCDIARKHRWMRLRKMSPYDMKLVIESIELLLEKRVLPSAISEPVSVFVKKCHELWHVENMESSRNITKCESNFHRHPNDKMRLLSKNIEIQQMVLHKFIEKTGGQCQLKESVTANKDIQIVTTRKKWNLCKHHVEDVRMVEMKSNVCHIHSDSLDLACQQILQSKLDLAIEQVRCFFQEMDMLMETYSDDITELTRYVEYEDVMMCFAHCSQKYHYTRPQFLSSTSSSAIQCQGMRHAIIEQIQDKEQFVENDVMLTDKTRGMLIYGLNSAGKSTLLKSVGICIFLAQIGMFVPAQSFGYTPFRSIFTKIYVVDNIYKGQSTFLYELSELKHILGQCDAHSLVLCDELTSGTETYSATGLLASTLLHCIAQKSRVMFTTHLHTLATIQQITENESISIQHFSVYVKNGSVFYDRTLQPGMGESLYGIEIAEAIGFPASFIKTAFDVRNKVAGRPNELVTNRRSRYNRKVIMDRCSKCHSTTDLHTHHIIPQQEFGSDGYIDNVHKNRVFNLEVLCRRCHLDEHATHEPNTEA